MVRHNHKIPSQVVAERVAVAMLAMRLAMLYKDHTQHSIEMEHTFSLCTDKI